MSAAQLLYDSHGRLRAPWRLAAFAIASMLAYAVLGLIVSPLVALGSGTALNIGAPLLVAALLIAHAVVLKWIERGRPWSFVWMDERAAEPRPLALGTALGALGIAVPSLLLLGIGWLSVVPEEGGRWLHVAWAAASLLLPAALAEELLVRGYPFAVLREAVGWRTALVGTSVAFGLLHLGNPNVTAMSIGLVTLAGVFLGAVLLVTGSLYAATLAHFAWNWVMAGVLHVPVSGLVEFPSAGYRLVDSGPDWATGGMWGPEGGAGAMIGMGAGIWYLFARAGGRALVTRQDGREER